MAPTERNRDVLYRGLTRAVGDEEAVEAMLSQLPARDVDGRPRRAAKIVEQASRLRWRTGHLVP